MQTIWNLADLGSYIHALSQKAGFATKEAFADHCGLSRSHYSKITNGRIAVPVKMIRRLFQKLGIPVFIHAQQYITLTVQNEEILINPLPLQDTAGQALRTYREAHGVTQTQVADILHIGQCEVSDIERGRFGAPLSEKIFAFLQEAIHEQKDTYGELALLEVAHPLLLMSESILRLIEKRPKNFLLIRHALNRGHERILIVPNEQWLRYGAAVAQTIQRTISDKDIRSRLRIYTGSDILFHLKLTCAIKPGKRILEISMGDTAITLPEKENLATALFVHQQLEKVDSYWKHGERASIQGFFRCF